MKFECLGEQFIKAVEQVAKARSKTTTGGYLQDVYVSLEEHILTLRATNLEFACEKSISVKGLSNGATIIKGDIFVKTVQLLKNKNTPLVCELVEGVFVITTGKDVIEIKTNKEEDFPTLPKRGEDIVTLSQEMFSSLVREVSFCVATTEIKPEIASIYVYTNGQYLYTVATDSYRLAEKKTEYQGGDFNILLPGKYINEILSILETDDGDITISLHETTASFTKNSLTVCVQITKGQFPDYRQLFPKEFTTKTLLKKDDLSKALTLTSLFIENYTPLSCEVEGNTLTLQSKNEATGSATQLVEVKTEGESIKAHYNNRYFLDVLPHLEGQEIMLSFTVPTRPMVITSTHNTSFTYLLMPVNR